MTNSKLFIPFIWKVLLITLIINVDSFFINYYLFKYRYLSDISAKYDQYVLLLAMSLRNLFSIRVYVSDKNRFFAYKWHDFQNLKR